jgi:hypothetical protein
MYSAVGGRTKAKAKSKKAEAGARSSFLARCAWPVFHSNGTTSNGTAVGHNNGTAVGHNNGTAVGHVNGTPAGLGGGGRGGGAGSWQQLPSKNKASRQQSGWLFRGLLFLLHPAPLG